MTSMHNCSPEPDPPSLKHVYFCFIDLFLYNNIGNPFDVFEFLINNKGIEYSMVWFD